ncbi:antibiotic biosynthesis monooxygenase [Mycobacterium montefiorense]|uniref:antibiotic biosynthesis monooxygenase n=1 Tax=Mycobacterium montefiorense TaxID=154654 RepID=UPI0021F30549|nr:antibiotic biosynthesis monooxygenase [Mycobacterium montefiorense]MCV7429905.1 antibiotic biosynthesis monooxygenase [Mycobacterium montefiorense]
MTADACAITLFHPPSDPARFGQWVVSYLASARHSPGHVGARESVQGSRPLDWAVEVAFHDADSLDAWLDSPDRQAVLRDGKTQGCWQCASDLVLTAGESPAADVGVFLHSVTPGKEAEFIAAQSELTRSSSAFPGYEGTAVFPADSSGQQWMSVLRFRSPGQLTKWMRSRERQEALPDLRGGLTRDFAELARSAPFGSTVRVADGQTRITPAWKSAMLVLLCLYPTVMLLSKSLSPALGNLGVSQSVSVFTGNVISIVALQWLLVPAVSRPFRCWLDPIDGAPVRISVAGAAAIVVGYAALLVAFLLGG